MPPAYWTAPGLVCVILLIGCSAPPKPAASTPKPADAVRITQFYTTTPQVPKGEKGMVCYGVENAKSVWLSPPKQELSAALARCVEITPAGRTTYQLTAEGRDGKTATQELSLDTGPARVRIVNVDISAAEVKPGDVVSVCYTVDNAQSVTVEPVRFRAGSGRHGCLTDQPKKTTTYLITANGSSGETDREQVTIKVAAGR